MTVRPSLGYDHQAGYQPCQCWRCDESERLGYRRMALRIPADPSAFPRLRLLGRTR